MLAEEKVELLLLLSLFVLLLKVLVSHFVEEVNKDS